MFREQAIEVLTTYTNEEGLLVFPLAFPINSTPLAVIPLFNEDEGMINSHIELWKENFMKNIVDKLKSFESVETVWNYNDKEVEVYINQDLLSLFKELEEKQKHFDDNIDAKVTEIIDLFETIRQTEFYLIDLATEVKAMMEAIEEITKEYHEEMSDIKNW